MTEASAARVQARDEAVRMLTTGRERRLRADAEAAALRERRDAGSSRGPVAVGILRAP